MSNVFEQGTMLDTVQGQKVRIERCISRGSRGVIYGVTVDGERKLLRWFLPAEDLKEQWDRTMEKVQRGISVRCAYWPEDLTEIGDGGFGYLTRLQIRDGKRMLDCASGAVTFSSFGEKIRLAVNLVRAFRKIHELGYCFNHNEMDIEFKPTDFSVLLTDTEAIVPIGTRLTVNGSPRYCAPEVVQEDFRPGIETDLYTLGIALMMLFCNCHPLEGRRCLVPILTPEAEQALYIQTPVFLFDRENKDNRPHPMMHRGVESVWNALPGYMKELFHRLFDQEGLRNPQGRPREEEWLRVLCRMKNDHIRCSCGNEIYLSEQGSNPCRRCGKPLPKLARLVLPEYVMPVVKDRDLYRCQLGEWEFHKMLEKLARVEESEKNHAVLCLKNTGSSDWTAYTPSGAEKTVKQGETVPILHGIRVIVEGVELRIEAG